jgi:hypothetical protein
MAKTQILEYTIYLTDKAQVDAYNAQLAAGAGPGLLLNYFSATDGVVVNGVLRAPSTGAAIEFSAPIQLDNEAFVAPCIRSPWFTFPASANFPTNVATFTRKSGGWFGIPSLFGSSTKFYWAGRFAYSSPPTTVVNPDPTTDPPTTGGFTLVPAAIPIRRWMNGFEMVQGDECATAALTPVSSFSPSSSAIAGPLSRTADRAGDGVGYAYRNASAAIETNQYIVASGIKTGWERLYFRLRRAGSGACEFWRVQNASTSGSGFSINVMPDGSLAIYGAEDGTMLLLETLSTPLVVDRWYRFDMMYVLFGITGTPDVRIAYLDLWKDGVLLTSTPTIFPQGIASNIAHTLSTIGKNAAPGNSMAEYDISSWRCAALPQNCNTLGTQWTTNNAYSVGDVVIDTGTGGAAIYPRPASLRSSGWVYRCKSAHTSDATHAVGSLPISHPELWDRLSDSLDFVNGSRMVVVRPTALNAATANWTGDFRLALQRPADNTSSSHQFASTTANAPLSLDTDIANAVHRLPGAIGAAALAIGIYSARGAAPNGTLGATVTFSDASTASISDAMLQQLTNPKWTGTLLNLVNGTQTLLKTITACVLQHTKGNDASSGIVRSFHAVAEVIGTFGNEDVPAGGQAMPTLIGPLAQHNAPYPRSPWASQSNPFGAVAVIGGTYTGNGTAQDLTFPVPVHWLWIRRVTGTTDTGARWWAPMYQAHSDIAQNGTPYFLGPVEEDPTFVPAGTEDSQEKRYRARIISSHAQINAAATTYQYIAFCDPSARFLLTGTLAHNNSWTRFPVDNALAKSDFTPIAGFLWPESLGATATARAAYKGPGHTTAGTASILTGAALTSYADFAAGVLQTNLNAHPNNVYQTAYALFRNQDGNAGINGVVQYATWVGDGVASRSIGLTPALSKRPLLAHAMGASPAGYFRDPSHTGTNSTALNTGTQDATGITAGGLDQITVASGLNANGTTYHVFVIPGDATAGNNGWGANGTFYPVEPDSPSPPGWVEPTEVDPADDDDDDGGEGGSPTAPDLDGTTPVGVPGENTGGLPGGQTCEYYTRSLVNIALSRIGISKVLTNLATDNTEEATVARRHVLEDINAVLRDFPWAFATRYATLVRVAGTDLVPVNADWQYSYRAPDAMMFARRIVPQDDTRRRFDPDPIEFRAGTDTTGALIYCNETSTTDVPLVLEYTLRLSCPAFFGDALFRETLTWKFAHSLAPALAKDSKKQDQAWRMYQACLAMAKTPSVREQQQEPMDEGDAEWIRARG